MIGNSYLKLTLNTHKYYFVDQCSEIFVHEIRQFRFVRIMGMLNHYFCI